MDVGALSLLIGEQGFAATMQKVAQLDTAAAKVGAKPAELKVAAPTVAPVAQSLSRLQQQAAATSGTPITLRANWTQVAQATAAVTQNTAATQQNSQAQQQHTQTTQQQVVTQQRHAASVTASGRAYDTMTPKVRSAANGMAALAFATAAGTPNLQSMSLAAGLVATSLLEAFGPASIAAYASGIGALVVLAGTLVGVIRRLNEEAKPTARTLEHLGNIDRVSTYNRELQNMDRKLSELLPKMTAWERFRSLNPLVNLGLAPTESERQFNQLLADREALVKRGTDLLSEQARAVAAAQREAAVSAANDQLRVQQSLIDRQESLNQQAYALGQITLRDYYDTRVRIAQERSEAVVRALEAERRALSVAPVGEKPDEAISRNARRAAVQAEIDAELTARRTATQQFIAEREAAERALAQRIAGFERQRLEAQGRTHEARLQQIEQEAREFERTLAARPDLTPQGKADMVNAFRDALVMQERFNEAQRASQRVFEDIGVERARIQAMVDRGQIGELEGQQRIAAAERARLPELQRIAAAMLSFAQQLQNPDLIRAAQQLVQSLSTVGANPFTTLERHFHDTLRRLEQLASPAGKRIADALRKAVEEKNLTITPQVVFEIDAVASSMEQLQQNVAGLAIGVGNTIGSSLAAGFSSAFTKGSGKNFAEALGNAMLRSIGDIMVQLGGSMVTYGLIMAAAAPLLAFTPFANQALSAPVAIGAGTALIAVGAGLGAIAANNSGSRTGGGGSSSRGSLGARPASVDTSSVILDPDRRLRERNAVAPTVAAGSGAAVARAPSFVSIENLHSYGSTTPQLERLVAASNRGADSRNIPTTRKRR